MDKTYFDKVYKEAVEFTAYICELYNIDPLGTVVFNGVTVPTILCHQDAYKLKLGSDHSDVLKWFKQFGKTMQDVRNDVYTILKNKKAEYFVKIGGFGTKAEAEKVQAALKVLGTNSTITEK